jgi:hypothetical protein
MLAKELATTRLSRLDESTQALKNQTFQKTAIKYTYEKY